MFSLGLPSIREVQTNWNKARKWQPRLAGAGEHDVLREGLNKKNGRLKCDLNNNNYIFLKFDIIEMVDSNSFK